MADVDWPGCTYFSASISNCNCTTVSIRLAVAYESRIPVLSPSSAAACHIYPPGLVESSVYTLTSRLPAVFWPSEAACHALGLAASVVHP